MTTVRLCLTTATLSLAAACASTGPPPPSEKATNSSAAIRAAEEVGAKHDPTAALHLQLAKEQFEHATNGKKDQARVDRLLLRAQVDAELALALARTETEKAQAQEAIAKVKTLKDSANR